MYFYLPDWPKLAKNQGFLKIGLFEKEALGTFYPELFTTGTHRTDPSTQARVRLYDGPQGDHGGGQPSKIGMDGWHDSINDTVVLVLYR